MTNVVTSFSRFKDPTINHHILEPGSRGEIPVDVAAMKGRGLTNQLTESLVPLELQHVAHEVPVTRMHFSLNGTCSFMGVYYMNYK